MTCGSRRPSRTPRTGWWPCTTQPAGSESTRRSVRSTGWSSRPGRGRTGRGSSWSTNTCTRILLIGENDMGALKRLRWRCQECGGRVVGDSGYFGASFADIRDAVPVRWRVFHDTCQPDDDTYSIDVVRLATPEDVAWWTEHLADKNWYLRSDWRSAVHKRTGFLIPDAWDAHAEREAPPETPLQSVPLSA